MLLNMEKDAIRETVWDALEEEKIARFPFPPHGRIPNVAGASAAAERLVGTAEWKGADAIKINPDSPQRPVRKRALQAGNRLFMAVPRLQDPQPFLELDGTTIDDEHEASTIGGAAEYGEPVDVVDMPTIDLVVSGSVAVDVEGGRIGKGEGYSDLEYAILREFDRIDVTTPVATTVHERQLWDEPLPTDSHDVPMNLIVTAERIVRPPTPSTVPDGIDWSHLDDETVAEIPVLERLSTD